MSTPAAADPWLLVAADRLRARVLRALGPAVHPYLVDRERRVVALAIGGLFLSFALTGSAPLLLLSLGPILLGLPHLFADFRYLVFRPRWYRHRASLVAVGVPLALCGLVDQPIYGWAAVVGAALVAPGRWWRRAGVALVAFAALIAAYRAPSVMRMGLVHGHNLVALALWFVWRRGSPERWRPIFVFLAFYGAILLGVFDRFTPGAASWRGWEESLAPGAFHPQRWVYAFAFAQSVHYAVWLRWIPEDDRARFTPRPLAASWRAAIDDVGRPLVMATVVGSLSLVSWACFDADAARRAYLRFVQFHGYLELAAIASWSAGRARVLTAADSLASRLGVV